MAFESDLNLSLAQLEGRGLRRHLGFAEDIGPTRLVVDGRSYLNFASNDYLGLASHPALKDAARDAVERFGVGAGASRLVTGSHRLHAELEAKLAAWKGVPRALAFSSGYATAVGVIPALAGSNDVVILDKLAHACLIDGARLSGAQIRVFPHNHLGKLESLLRTATNATGSGSAARGGRRVLVITESVFSMDGDRSDLKAVVELKDHYGACLLVDEAHAAGLLGPQGAGLASLLGLEKRIDLQMGTLSKALGASGGYLAGADAVIEFLINRARSFVFSTAPPPAIAAAATAALKLAAGPEGQRLREGLWSRAGQLAAALPGWTDPHPASAIIPLKLGPERDALHAAAALREAGIWVPAIRYPTVARGAARLRVTVSAVHSPAMVTRLAEALRGLLPDRASPGHRAD